jgi:hypothetical protein
MWQPCARRQLGLQVAVSVKKSHEAAPAPDLRDQMSSSNNRAYDAAHAPRLLGRTSMNGLRSCVGRSLLVLVLAGAAFGCGDDDDNPAPDSGTDGGLDGGPMAGRGGAGNGADGGDAGPTMMECVDETSDNTQGMAPAACVQCVCENGPREAVACNATCWGLVQCYALNCADVPVDNPNASAACAADKCGTSSVSSALRWTSARWSTVRASTSA